MAGEQDEDHKEGEHKKEGPDEQRSKPPWPWFLAGLVVIGFIAVVLVIIYAPSDTVWTDDAYVTAHYATIAPRISGQVSSVDVEDNQTVRAGQVLTTLDDRDFRTTLATDEAMLARDQAQADDIAAQIARLPSQIAQSQASVASSAAQLVFAQQNETRYRNLASTGAGSGQERQQAAARCGRRRPRSTGRRPRSARPGTSCRSCRRSIKQHSAPCCRTACAWSRRG